MVEFAFQPEEELRRELARFSRWLGRLGFTPGTSGNLSVRLDRHRLLVTPTGMSKALLKASDMVIVDMHGGLLEGTRKVTSEISMHLAVYHRRADVGAVVHSHPPIATAFACSGRALDEMLCQEAVMTLGVVPLASYATTGTDEVAASLVPHILGHDAILMANHGVVSYGETLTDAFLKMETVEHLAQVALVAHQLGSAQPLEVEQVEQLHAARARYLRNAGIAMEIEEAAEVEDRAGLVL
ncbi:class II aldolase/adducin family protein [Acidicapsa ligni]|uniref:class II aldolase/adducin family protein n=1 Tax=Acidicapsa ligni TaxID=542300 RepID=UPI0021DF881B|nr:class II aldolase/adducin family protein [Acidicapsa ligni]